jgi:hypothetical protein
MPDEYVTEFRHCRLMAFLPPVIVTIAQLNVEGIFALLYCQNI